MERVNCYGWECLRLVSGDYEAMVTLEVGPRVIRLGRVGGPNLLHVKQETIGKKDLDGYNGYGGHRLWIAPEHDQLSYYAENAPVEELADGWLASARDEFGLQRAIRVQTLGAGMFRVSHRIDNQGAPIELAPWALTVMTTGGECFFPKPPFQTHSENYLPVAPLVLWSYTNLSDPRWNIDQGGFRLKQDLLPPQKAGMFVAQGWACYHVDDTVFLKTFGADRGARYPDFGCNFETFTREDMLEVESLGPLAMIESGQTVEHEEVWSLSHHAGRPSWEDLASIVSAIGSATT